MNGGTQMAQTATYNTKPAAIDYMALPDRPEADVWLRKDIKQVTLDEPGPDGQTVQGKYWQASEVYFRAEITAADVSRRFDELFKAPPVPPPTFKPPTNLERIEALEAGMLELAGVIYGG